MILHNESVPVGPLRSSNSADARRKSRSTDQDCDRLWIGLIFTLKPAVKIDELQNEKQVNHQSKCELVFSL